MNPQSASLPKRRRKDFLALFVALFNLVLAAILHGLVWCPIWLPYFVNEGYGGIIRGLTWILFAFYSSGISAILCLISLYAAIRACFTIRWAAIVIVLDVGFLGWLVFLLLHG